MGIITAFLARFNPALIKYFIIFAIVISAGIYIGVLRNENKLLNTNNATLNADVKQNRNTINSLAIQLNAQVEANKKLYKAKGEADEQLADSIAKANINARKYKATINEILNDTKIQGTSTCTDTMTWLRSKSKELGSWDEQK